RSDEGARSDLKLGVAVGARVQDVAGRQRGIGLGLGPLLSAGTPERHLAVEVAHTSRRDLARLLRRGRGGRRERALAADREREDEKRDEEASAQHGFFMRLIDPLEYLQSNPKSPVIRFLETIWAGDSRIARASSRVRTGTPDRNPRRRCRTGPRS